MKATVNVHLKIEKHAFLVKAVTISYFGVILNNFDNELKLEFRNIEIILKTIIKLWDKYLKYWTVVTTEDIRL